MSLYALLDVPADASTDDIEAGYRRACEALAGQGGGLRSLLRHWRLHRLARAYARLRDPAERRAYDAGLLMIEMLGRCPPGLL